VLKEYHTGALEQAEARELVGNLYLIGDQFDTELDEAAGDVTAPDDPLQAGGEEQKPVVAGGEEQKHVVAGGEEQKHVVAGGEEQKHVVARAVSPEEPGPTQPKVGTNVVSTKVGE
jgi:hypothetical protein